MWEERLDRIDGRLDRLETGQTELRSEIGRCRGCGRCGFCGSSSWSGRPVAVVGVRPPSFRATSSTLIIAPTEPTAPRRTHRTHCTRTHPPHLPIAPTEPIEPTAPGPRHPSGFWNTSSTLRPKASAIRNASGSDGSNRPFSIALTELRDTLTRSASSAWLQPFSARSTRMRFFTPAPARPSRAFPCSPHAPLPDDGRHHDGKALHEHDQDQAEHKRQVHGAAIGRGG